MCVALASELLRNLNISEAVVQHRQLLVNANLCSVSKPYFRAL